jgi:hypothetical protein
MHSMVCHLRWRYFALMHDKTNDACLPACGVCQVNVHIFLYVLFCTLVHVFMYVYSCSHIFAGAVYLFGYDIYIYIYIYIYI